MRQVIAALVLGLAAGGAFAQAKEIKIGVVYDLTGPLAAGGSNASYLGTKYAIDIINERGGVDRPEKPPPLILNIFPYLGFT